MRISIALVIGTLVLGAPHPARGAALRVVSTIPELAALVREVGGSEVESDAIAKGTQDYHYLEAKPSYMVRLSRADLVIACGLELETAWLAPVLRGARNPRIQAGTSGYLELGPWIDPIEVATGKLSRAQGDVHPSGNPHFYLDPIRMGLAALKIAERLGELSPEKRENYLARARSFQARMEERTKGWKDRIEAAGVKSVVTYHRTLSYFLQRFGVGNPAVLEPKPGVPPTSGHILAVIETIREQKIPVILVENHFDSSVTRRIVEKLPGIRVSSVPVTLGGGPGTGTLESLYETLVKAVTGK